MRIHFIAIGGAIMHSLAIELKKMGHTVTGSDDVIYEPAKSNLLKYNLLPDEEGWYPDNIHLNIDLVILGMHAKLDNPELLLTQKMNIPLMSFPEYIFEYSKHKKRIVIAGSHGKTTITSMILHVLHDNNMKVDYLLGAKIDSIKNLVSLENNDVIVIEGDEYFSSALDKRSKFMHYNPDILVVSGVEWDHVNVFPTLDLYQDTFRNILNITCEKSKQIFYCGDDDFLSDFLTNTNYITPYYLPKYKIKNNQFLIEYDSKEIPLNIFGKHNLYNLEAARLVALRLGVSESQFYKSIQSFQGAEKRLNLIKNNPLKNSAVFYDFAHSPSKVAATINAVKELFPNRYLVACLQLYTFSSLDINFMPNYANVFKDADEVWIYVDEISMQQKNQKNIPDGFLLDVICHNQIRIIKDKNGLKKYLYDFQFKNSNLLLMSSGNFSNINLMAAFSE
ncbi:MAG: peptidoglycan synthetase [Flavobacteriales bacterium]|nr:peptidoglycan synthetase [Flavobacteriales bacterium]